MPSCPLWDQLPSQCDPNWAQMLICALDLKMQPIHQAASDALLGPGNEDVNLSQDSTPDQGAGHPGMTEP